MDISLPSRSALKAQAKRLRAELTAKGQPITHAAALEAIAHQWGARDWNTLHALADDDPRPQYAPGQRISGRYLGHRFKGRVKAASDQNGHWRLTLIFDEAVDVVRSNAFSALRRQVNVTVGPKGRTAQKTSDGVPHMVLDSHWSA